MPIKERILNQLFAYTLTGTLLLTGGCGYNTKAPQAESPKKTEPSLQAEQHPLSGKVFSMISGTQISYAELLKQLRNSRFILVGEKHDNPEHHRLELQLLQDLQNGTKTRLVLEMLDEQQGENIPKLSATSSESEIKTLLNWSDSSWPWQDYGPLISSALKDGNQLKAGNLSKPLLMQIYKKGLPDQPRLATVSDIPQTIRSTIQQQVFESHCQAIPMEQMGPMTSIQLSRDASMAYALSDQLGKQMQAILITGAFHARKDTGVPQHLKKLTSKAVVSILLTETDDALTTAAEAISSNAGVADYIWFTSRSEKKDYCASLRQQPPKKDD
ncbi:ChaN family lipoprotein [uncultured Amphritea sp.]|uniref:ChaN family lipoprotein n=1 Tax=uncultured Amphritea sp. TaxID=981605 RepID=UPI00261D3815|nr:ChaN family lipoprotein [uncultured Amphritea sp.]